MEEVEMVEGDFPYPRSERVPCNGLLKVVEVVEDEEDEEDEEEAWAGDALLELVLEKRPLK
jgi:hypothetical protein